LEICPADFSPTAKWLAYGINAPIATNELGVTNIATAQRKSRVGTLTRVFRLIPLGGIRNSKFRSAGRKTSPAEEAYSKENGTIDLSTELKLVVDAVETFSFSPNGTYLAMRKYSGKERRAGTARMQPQPPTPMKIPRAQHLLWRQLSTGHDTSFGNSFRIFCMAGSSAHRHLLAMAINSDDKTGNGVQRQIRKPERFEFSILHPLYTAAYRGGKTARISPCCARSLWHREGNTYVVMAWDASAGFFRRRSHVDPTTAQVSRRDGASFPIASQPGPKKAAWCFSDCKVEEKSPAEENSSSSRCKQGRNSADGEEEPASVDIGTGYEWT